MAKRIADFAETRAIHGKKCGYPIEDVVRIGVSRWTQRSRPQSLAPPAEVGSQKKAAPLREERGRGSIDAVDQYPKTNVRLFDVPKPPAAGRTNACKSNATPQSAGMFGKPIGSESAPDAS